MLASRYDHEIHSPQPPWKGAIRDRGSLSCSNFSSISNPAGKADLADISGIAIDNLGTAIGINPTVSQLKLLAI